ncbi:hypothetical protein CEXT_560051 [Caerostris extrusa]|uniref:Uncharacterized protein n=1 Tax=Caerostris extrusa TaxID=172846 RepID=A0AAV4XSR3_CAEEX|nr:hypothetical protein CEXT_560051 [Caerostris extrusa]
MIEKSSASIPSVRMGFRFNPSFGVRRKEGRRRRDRIPPHLGRGSSSLPVGFIHRSSPYREAENTRSENGAEHSPSLSSRSPPSLGIPCRAAIRGSWVRKTATTFTAALCFHCLTFSAALPRLWECKCRLLPPNNEEVKKRKATFAPLTHSENNPSSKGCPSNTIHSAAIASLDRLTSARVPGESQLESKSSCPPHKVGGRNTRLNYEILMLQF